MSDRLEVDAEGLAADGRDLADLGNPAPKAEACPAPASDPVSTSMAAALTAHGDGLCQRLSQALSVREHGGAIVTASGVMFEVADEHGALEISKVEIVGERRPASAGPPAINVVAKPDLPKTIAKVSPISPQSLDPEEFSEAVHSGAGSSGL